MRRYGWIILLKKNKIKEIHYLKIDAEGNDLNVLQSLGSLTKKVWGFELETWNKKILCGKTKNGWDSVLSI